MIIEIAAHNIVRGDGQGRVLYEIIRYGTQRGHAFVCSADQFDSGLLSDLCSWIPIHPRPRKPNLVKEWAFARQCKIQARHRRTKGHLTLGVGFSASEPVDVCIAQFVHAAFLSLPVHTSRVTKPPYSWYQWLYSRINARRERAAFRSARAVVAASRIVAEQLVKHVGISKDKITVIENAVDPNEFKVEPESRDRLGRLSTFPGTIATFVGDIRTPRKNLDTVLKALVHVPQLGLAIVGNERNSPYPKLASELGVANRVAFLGFRNDVDKIQRAADFFVFPSRYEPFGIVVLEAMASGKPVITARTTGAADLVSSAAGIVVADPENVNELAVAMTTLALNPELRRSMGIEGRRIAEAHTWEKMATQYFELFEILASHRSTTK